MKIHYDKDIGPDNLKGIKTAVIGYGSQGFAQANNLGESGVDIVVGLLEKDPGWAKAERAGLFVTTIPEAVSQARIVMILVPDEVQPDVYEKLISPSLAPESYLAFAHGFNIHYDQIKPDRDINVFMVAPKGPGHLVRSEYVAGRGVPCLAAVHQDPSGDTMKMALGYASAIGGGRAGVIETTFKDETETDLFGEQAVLCGGATSLVMTGYETLVEAGYPAELAYFECLHELKLIVDLMYQDGISTMRYSISNTAQYGDLTRGPRVINQAVREEMRKILAEVQNGEFAREWIAENKAGRPRFDELTKKGEEHPIEEVGRRLRSMMPWLHTDKLVDREEN